jgi:N-formylglutamate amidohydrolase
VDKTRAFCKDHNLSLGIDWPYSGTMVPTEYYNRNSDVFSIMIEINRKLYLMEGTNIRSSGYRIIKKAIFDLLAILREG